MNTKKIWTTSIILGLMIAVFAYLTVYTKGKDTSAAAENKVVQSTDSIKTVSSQAKKPAIPQRDFKNPNR